MTAWLRRRSTLELVVTLLVTALALSGASVLYADAGWVAPATVGLLAGAAIATLSSVKGLRLAQTVLVFVLGSLVVVVIYGLMAKESDESLRSVVAGGWSRLLTVSLPAVATATTITPVVVIAAVGAFVAALAVLRTRSSLLPVLGIVVVAAAIGVLAGARVPYSNLRLFVLTAAALGVVLLRTQGGGSRAGADGPRPIISPNRSLAVLSAAHLLVAALLGVIAGSIVASVRSDRFEPRDHIESSVTDNRFVSPLADYKALITEKGSPAVAQVKPLSGDVPNLRLRLVALDHYDGSTWSSSATYRAASPVLPGPPAGVPTPPSTVTYEVSVAGLKWKWLPTAAGYPVRLDGARDLAVDAETGQVQVADDPDGMTYTVTTAAVDPVEDPAQLSGVSVGTPVPAPVMAFEPGTAYGQALGDLIVKVRDVSPDPGVRLQTLMTDLKGRKYADAAPPGHSLGVLNNFLAPDSPGGTAEHFAATFAVVANQLDIPSRVVVGLYDPKPDAAGTPVPLTTRDYHVWPEVYLADRGWVPIEVTPKKEQLDENHTQSTSPATTEVAAPTTAAPAQTASTLPPSSEDRGGGSGSPVSLTSGPWRFPLLLLLVALVVLGGIVGLKRLRTRRRRTRGTPRERVVGAWLDLTDRLAERGIAPQPTLTPHEVAAVTRERFGPMAGDLAGNVGAYVDNAVFGDHDMDDTDVLEAWGSADKVRREADRQRGLLRRAQAELDPRTLTKVG